MAEFLFGYDPTNPDSRFQITQSVEETSEAYQLTIQTLNERTYTILYSDDLTGDWSVFTNEVAGVWVEDRMGTNTCTFTDDFTMDTSGTIPTCSPSVTMAHL